jgi:hypothetical protein
MFYGDWQIHRAFIAVPAQAVVAKYLESFKEFPPRAKAATFTVSDAMEKIMESATKN